MFIMCYSLNRIMFDNLDSLSFVIKIGSLFLIIIICKIIYLTMILC